MHPEGVATSHLDKGFLGILCLQANAEMVLRILSCYCCSHATLPPKFKFIKINPLV